MPGIRHIFSGKSVADPRLHVDCLGLSFPNPIGLAAGFDKDAQWFNALHSLGFGAIEIGTVTLRPQPGNKKPRLFRLTKDQALVNRMGFNNEGAAAIAKRLSKATIRPVLGVNIGLNKETPLEEAAEDYRQCLTELHSFAAYITVNVSSPNTPGLRKLQDREPLARLLSALNEHNQHLAEQHQTHCRPILLKIAPDLTNEALDDVVSIAREQSLAGLIATNTTISRRDLTSTEKAVKRCGCGGLSGGPLTRRSRDVVEYLYRRLDDQLPIVGVGGLMDATSVWEMMRAGAALVQVYTGFIYGGPRFVANLLVDLQRRLDERGVESISDIVGEATR